MRRGRLSAALTATCALGLLTTVATQGAATPAGADAPTVYYLALGASDSVGYQPGPGGHAAATDHGYANDLVGAEADLGVPLVLSQLGCPGETTFTMLHGHDHCYAPGTSQLADALAFLHAHAADPVLVTVDLGFNDVFPCLHRVTSDPACLVRHLDALSDQLTSILSQLEAAAGPHVTFVGLNHYNPEVVVDRHDLRGAVDEAARVRAVDQMNNSLTQVYARFDVPVAQVDKAFDVGDTNPVTVAGLGTVSAQAARLCDLTWECAAPPLGPNVHPNDEGYQAIAAAVVAALPVGWNGA